MVRRYCNYCGIEIIANSGMSVTYASVQTDLCLRPECFDLMTQEIATWPEVLDARAYAILTRRRR